MAPPPAAEEAEATESAVPEPVELRQPDPAGGSGAVPAAERYHRAVPVSVGNASGSSPRPVPAEGVLAVKAPAEVVPADSSPGSAAVAVPAA